MDTSMILSEPIGARIMPIRSGGITLYPADELEEIFDWAESNGRSLEWIEGVFYDLKHDRGQHSLSYMYECGSDYAAFRARCLSLIPEIVFEAAGIGLDAYFEIGISASPNGS